MKFLIKCVVLAAVALATPSLASAASSDASASTASSAASASSTDTGVDAPDATLLASPELHVGVVTYDHEFALDYVGPASYFEFVTLANKTVRFTTISNRTGHIQKSDSPGLYANYAYKKAPTKFDVLLIPGGTGVDDVRADAKFIDYIKRAGEASTYVLSVCTGGNILASTGLLDGRNATTNKRKFKKIAALHPQVNWVRKARWVVDGKFWTSSGVTAGLDMGHAFYGFLYGKDKADEAATLIETVPITDSTNDPFEYVIDLN